MPDLDEDKLEQVMAAMAGDMENIDENDPRQVSRMMRKLFDATGMKMGSGMEEALRRMESGEDMEKIEEELGDVLEEEDPFSTSGKKGMLKGLRRRFLPPKVDETLYDL